VTDGFLENRKQRVLVNNSFSSDVNVRSGVPQGTVLGPLLFLLFVNDLPACLPVNSKLFADDLKLYISFAKGDNGQLDAALRVLEDWTSKWQLSIAAQKCCIMHIGKKNPRTAHHIHGLPLPQVQHTKDLGVTFQETLEFKEHIKNITRDSSRLTHVLFRVLRSKNPSVMCQAYKTYVRPRLEYASVVWSPSSVGQKDLIEDVQRVFTRRVFTRCALDPSSAKIRLETLGLQPLERRRIESDLNFVFKIFCGRAGIQPSDVFELPNLRTRGHNKRIRSKGIASSNVISSSFSFRVCKIWNSLPSALIASPSPESFKSSLKRLALL